MIVLVFHRHGDDHGTVDALRRAAMSAGATRAVCRNGDLFTGWIEAGLNRKPIAAIYAPSHPLIVAAYAAAGIPALSAPAAQPPTTKPKGKPRG